MGSGASVIIAMPLFLYLALMTLLCVKVGAKTSWKVGWLMAAGSVFMPLALFVAFLVP
ncbi:MULTISPECIES: hypothetical protein [Streptomyces]|jgi:hypothetical protein|uniref:hypothetical protein n=1 Tax=Streptomyces aurantiacus group TaxID=2838335 RepID=UPI000AF77C7E|nr:hypothetical protein [Streptomyces yerevanensis]